VRLQPLGDAVETTTHQPGEQVRRVVRLPGIAGRDQDGRGGLRKKRGEEVVEARLSARPLAEGDLDMPVRRSVVLVKLRRFRDEPAAYRDDVLVAGDKADAGGCERLPRVPAPSASASSRASRSASDGSGSKRAAAFVGKWLKKVRLETPAAAAMLSTVTAARPR
jgi:hypothetical protein